MPVAGANYDLIFRSPDGFTIDYPRKFVAAGDALRCLPFAGSERNVCDRAVHRRRDVGVLDLSPIPRPDPVSWHRPPRTETDCTVAVKLRPRGRGKTGSRSPGVGARGGAGARARSERSVRERHQGRGA